MWPLARSLSKVANSERKMDLEDEGGRYIVSRMKDRGFESEVVVKRAQSDSNEVMFGTGILASFRVER